MPRCPVCGAEKPEDQKLCNECAAKFSDSETGNLNSDTLLEGRYIIVRTLGRGGMGAVYMALDTRLNNKPVAIKEMSTKALGAGKVLEAIDAFKKEASILISLEHSALPRISDFFAKGEDRWYLVMDYIEGKTLKEIAHIRGPITEVEVLDWAKQLCTILKYLHNQNPPVIFRDLKPANIMLTPDGQIKLIDFGIARHFKPGTATDTTNYGSHGFAPPEQYGKNQTDERSDIYSLAATLHFLITGIDPHDNAFNFKPLREVGAISPAFENAIMKSLDLNPEKRPQNVEELFNLLPPQSEKNIDAAMDEITATISIYSDEFEHGMNPLNLSNKESVNNAQLDVNESRKGYGKGAHIPTTIKKLEREYYTEPRGKGPVWLIYSAPLIIALLEIALFFRLFPDVQSYLSSIALKIVLYLLFIAFIISLFFVGKQLNRKKMPDSPGAILKGKDAYYKIMEISQSIDEMKRALKSREVLKTYEKIKVLEEQLRLETDFGCGNTRVTDCENEIAEKINQLIDALSIIYDEEQFNKQQSDIYRLISGLTGLIKRRREFTKIRANV